MLGKLIKYELKSTARIFIPLYAALLIVSLIVGTFISSNQGMGFVGVIITFLYGALMVAVVVLTIVVVIQRFYKNLLCDEGYLMFTLPVKSSQHNLSKVIAALIWQSLSVIVGVLSAMCIMLISSIPFNIVEFFRELGRTIYFFQQESHINIALFAFLLIILMICSAAANTQMVYAALSVGHIYGKRPVLMSVACYIGFLIVLQIIGEILYNIVDR